MTIDFRQQTSDMLVNRINSNAKSQSLDFNTWVFDGFSFPENAKVLEICCGTGKQTHLFLDKLGSGASVTAVDASKESIERLREALAIRDDSRLQLVNCDMDALVENVLQQQATKYDLIFCSYGLYYSHNVAALLSSLKGFLGKEGAMVVVGPFGPNNEQLFSLVERTGAQIEEEIKFTSGQFMYEVVLPWMAMNFSSIGVRTTYNDVVWENVEDIIAYCQSTTYYHDELRDAFVGFARAEMDANDGKFLNKKWVMSLVARGAR